MSDGSPEAAVLEVAQVLVGRATDGWARLIWRATLSAGMVDERVEVILTSGAPADVLAQARMGLVLDSRGIAAAQQLGAALRAADGSSWHTVELTVEPGRIEAVASSFVTQSTGHLPPTYRVVVDVSRKARRVRHEDAESTVAGGDPHRVVELAEVYSSLYAEAMGEPLGLRDPATEEEIASVEATLGVTFPADLRALYRMADGEASVYGLFGGPTFLPLTEIVEQWQEWSQLDEGRSDVHVTIESSPPGVIRPVSPGPEGAAGQVIEFGRDHYDQPVSLVAGSVTDLLDELVTMLRAGDVDLEPGVSFWMFPSYTQVRPPPHCYDVKPTEQPLPDWLAALPDAGHVQELWLRDAGAVDLSPLAALPRLRILHVQGGIHVTGARALLSCPLEQLTVHTRQSDLSELSGHPTLRLLAVHGVGDPRLRLPAALPNVESLDVATSHVVDIGSVARFPELRSLTLNGTQWTELMVGEGPPAGLATAALTGESALRNAADWARQVAPETASSGLWHHSAEI